MRFIIVYLLLWFVALMNILVFRKQRISWISWKLNILI
ncbi:Uncharacterised protein [Serratia fonticola]|uniref:Uncharacterized protein n=1 Tax=Serratia fonticola TaxID=47917 RepID=A0A4U9V2S1_SERFO|nr:Uncharacterised protein [Serratia fonticola]